MTDLDGNGTLDIVRIGWDRYEYLHVRRNDNQSPCAGGERYKKFNVSLILPDRK